MYINLHFIQFLHSNTVRVCKKKAYHKIFRPNDIYKNHQNEVVDSSLCQLKKILFLFYKGAWRIAGNKHNQHREVC